MSVHWGLQSLGGECSEGEGLAAFSPQAGIRRRGGGALLGHHRLGHHRLGHHGLGHNGLEVGLTEEWRAGQRLHSTELGYRLRRLGV